MGLDFLDAPVYGTLWPKSMCAYHNFFITKYYITFNKAKIVGGEDNSLLTRKTIRPRIFKRKPWEIDRCS